MNNQLCLSEALPSFGEYLSVERRLRPKTIAGYSEALRFSVKLIGDLPVGEIQLETVILLKRRLQQRGCGESRVSQVASALKSLLTYVRDVLGIRVMDVSKIKSPRIPRREVEYLTAAEVERFVNAIPLLGISGQPRLVGYCSRALVETLLATGMRISEAVQLDRSSVNYEAKEALIVGKGNRERTVFFSNRALEWLTAYLSLRRDSSPELFVTTRLTRMTVDNAQQLFRRYRARGGLEKKVTPHVLRHTAATLLLKNGCPIGFIKEILGHRDLMTTCRYYLGVLDKKDVKCAHEKYGHVSL